MTLKKRIVAVLEAWPDGLLVKDLMAVFRGGDRSTVRPPNEHTVRATLFALRNAGTVRQVGPRWCLSPREARTGYNPG